MPTTTTTPVVTVTPPVVAPVAAVVPAPVVAAAPVVAPVATAPARRLLTPNSLVVFSVNDFGKTIILNGNTILLPKALTSVGKIVAIGVPTGGTASLLKAVDTDLIGTATTLSIAPGQEVVLRRTVKGYEVVSTTSK